MVFDPPQTLFFDRDRTILEKNTDCWLPDVAYVKVRQPARAPRQTMTNIKRTYRIR